MVYTSCEYKALRRNNMVINNDEKVINTEGATSTRGDQIEEEYSTACIRSKGEFKKRFLSY